MDIVELLEFSVKYNVLDLYFFVGVLFMVWIDGEVRKFGVFVFIYFDVYCLIFEIMNDV